MFSRFLFAILGSRISVGATVVLLAAGLAFSTTSIAPTTAHAARRTS